MTSMPIIMVTALFSSTILKRRHRLQTSYNQSPKQIGICPNKMIFLTIVLHLILPCALGCNPNCIICDNHLNCGRCHPGFYISGKFCYPCSGPTGIANCFNCNGKTKSCTICAYGYVVTTPQTCYPCAASSNCLQCTYAPYMLQCMKCATGFTVTPLTLTCISCLSAMFGCASCSSPTVCNSCVNTTFMLNSTAQCQPCWQAFYQCYRCSSINCYQCNNGYNLQSDLTCTPCTTTLSNCILCLNGNNCTECVSNQFYLDLDRCVPCAAIFPYCQTCIHARCLSCFPDFYLTSNLTCKCKKGNPVSRYCIQVPGCSSAILYKGTPKCLTCTTNEFIYNTTTVRCDCKKGILLGSHCSQLYGCITMIIANKTQVCLMCNGNKHFYLKNGNCVCRQGYYVSQADNNCKQVCGDGILMDLPCDDGNNIDGDGCSSKCNIEQRFECFNGSSTTPSKCLSILKNFSFQLLDISKLPDSNTAKFEFRIISFDPFISIISWKNLISVEIAQNHDVMDMVLRGNLLTIKLKYQQDLEGKNATLMLNLSADYFLSPKIVNYAFAIKSSNAPLIMMAYPSKIILRILSIFMLCLCISAFLLLFFGAILHKMVGIETLSVFQVLTATPYLITDRSVVLSLFDHFFLANGLGKSFYYNQHKAQTFGETFEDLGLPKSFTENMYINEGILLLSLILSALGFLAIYCFPIRKKSKRSQKISQFVLFCNNLLYALSMTLFFITFISINANNFRVYSQTYSGTKFESTSNYQQFIPYLNASTAILVIMAIGTVNVLNMITPATRKEAIVWQESPIFMNFYQTFQKLNLNNKIYVSFFTINHLLIFSLITILLFKPTHYAIFVLFFYMVPFSLSVIIFRPYKRIIDNLGVCIGNAIQLLFISCLATKQILYMLKIVIPLIYELVACTIFTMLLTVLIGLSLARLISLILKKDRKQLQTIEPLIQPKNPETQYQSTYEIKQGALQKPLKQLKLASRDTQELIRLKNQLKSDLLDRRKNLFRNMESGN